MEENKVRFAAAPGEGEEKPSTSPSPGLQRIIVFGHPHCGTTILRSIIGHCDSVQDTPQEKLFVKDSQIPKGSFKVYKFPYMIKPREHEQCHKIMILRNPLYVYSSINRRFNFKIPALYQVPYYLKALRFFDSIKNKKYNLYKITYEDLFLEGHQKIKEILDSIGIRHTKEIFDNTKFHNRHLGGSTPEDRMHSKLREAQINKLS